MDVIYGREHYFIYEHIQKVIWKKSNDKTQASRWLQLPGSGTPGRTLKLALNGEMIVVNNGSKGTVTFVELLKDASAGDIKEETLGSDKNLTDFVIFGEKNDHLAVLTKDKQIFTLKFEIEEEHIKIERQNLVELRGIEGREEIGFSLSPCPKSHFMAVSLLDEHRKASSIEIYDIRNEELKFKANIDIFDKNNHGFSAFDFYGYHGNELILTCISKSSPSAEIVSYYFNVNNNHLREGGPRKAIACGNVYKFVRRREGGELHVSDENGDRKSVV